MDNRIFSRREFLEVAGAGAFAVALAGCSSDDATSDDDTDFDSQTEEPTEPAPEPEKTPAQKMLDSMTLEQKVAQLFFVTPEELTGVEVATVSGDATKAALEALPVGGLIYFSKNIVGVDQIKSMLSGAVELSKGAGAGVPVFTGVDEEGGPLVARIANSGLFDVEQFGNMADIGATGDTSQAAHVGTTIGGYLHDIGFTVDFAPDADVLTNPNNTAIGPRSFSSDPNVVSEMVSAEVSAMVATGTQACAKHFPGHGDTAGDSHTGAAESDRSLSDLQGCEFLPFQAAAKAGVPFVMVGHITTPNALVEDADSAAKTGANAGDALPATLSYKAITQTLRESLGFNGVVISDSMSMGAITQYYSQSQAAVKFLQAGGDMVLMPEDLNAAYQGVLDAVNAGNLTEDRINESTLRILTAKQSAGLIS